VRAPEVLGEHAIHPFLPFDRCIHAPPCPSPGSTHVPSRPIGVARYHTLTSVPCMMRSVCVCVCVCVCVMRSVCVCVRACTDVLTKVVFATWLLSTLPAELFEEMEFERESKHMPFTSVRLWTPAHCVSYACVRLCLTCMCVQWRWARRAARPSTLRRARLLVPLSEVRSKHSLVTYKDTTHLGWVATHTRRLRLGGHRRETHAYLLPRTCVACSLWCMCVLSCGAGSVFVVLSARSAPRHVKFCGGGFRRCNTVGTRAAAVYLVRAVGRAACCFDHCLLEGEGWCVLVGGWEGVLPGSSSVRDLAMRSRRKGRACCLVHLVRNSQEESDLGCG
jgi:hypothetical protein